MPTLSPTQKRAVAALKAAAGAPRSAYQLQVGLRTLESLVKMGLAQDVTPPGPGAMFSPATHYKFIWAQGRRDKPSAAPPPDAARQEAEDVHPALAALRDVLDAVGALTNPSEMQNVLGFSEEDGARILAIANSTKGS